VVATDHENINWSLRALGAQLNPARLLDWVDGHIGPVERVLAYGDFGRMPEQAVRLRRLGDHVDVVQVDGRDADGALVKDAADRVLVEDMLALVARRGSSVALVLCSGDRGVVEPVAAQCHAHGTVCLVVAVSISCSAAAHALTRDVIYYDRDIARLKPPTCILWQELFEPQRRELIRLVYGRERFGQSTGVLDICAAWRKPWPMASMPQLRTLLNGARAAGLFGPVDTLGNLHLSADGLALITRVPRLAAA
jgi:hypothetical protein